MRARVASINLAQQVGWSRPAGPPGRHGPIRRPAALSLMRVTLRASLYMVQETDYDMAREIAESFRWGTTGQPAWRVDENRNGVIWDPAKWRDLRSKAVSLTKRAGDLGDAHYRSVQWVELEHRAGGEVIWFGSSHLSNGAGAGPDRERQAAVLVDHLPTGDALGPMVLGIDRNSLAKSGPAQILNRAGLKDLTLGASSWRSYPAGDARTDGVQIDAIHGRDVAVSDVRLVDPGRATDHRAWVLTIDTDLDRAA